METQLVLEHASAFIPLLRAHIQKEDRILYPMKKGSKGWERIEWDEALDTVAGKFKQVIEEHGPESILLGQGTGRDYISHFFRFAETVQRYHGPVLLFIQVFRHICPDKSRRDGIYRHILPSNLLGQGFCRTDNACLGSRIIRLARQSFDT